MSNEGNWGSDVVIETRKRKIGGFGGRKVDGPLMTSVNVATKKIATLMTSFNVATKKIAMEAISIKL